MLDDKGSGDYETVLSGLEVVLDIRLNNKLKPMVVSLSLSGPCDDIWGCEKDALVLSIEELHRNNVATVVAAGNNHEDACSYTPSASPEAITVGATTSSDSMASFSNWGSCLDVLAPGDSIRSACSSLTRECLHSVSSYSLKSGTSSKCLLF